MALFRQIRTAIAGTVASLGAVALPWGARATPVP
jgi:hypothetical protein